jgi:hypothetical protein
VPDGDGERDGVAVGEAAGWDAKYHHLRWRPWQAVPTVEPGWIPLLGTPNHPEFPAAHGCLMGIDHFS